MNSSGEEKSISAKTISVPELSASHTRTAGPGVYPEAAGRLSLHCSSSITTETDVLTIRQAVHSARRKFAFVFPLLYLCSAPSWWPRPPVLSAWSWEAWRWGWGRCRGRAETEPGEWGQRPGLASQRWQRGDYLQRMMDKVFFYHKKEIRFVCLNHLSLLKITTNSKAQT